MNTKPSLRGLSSFHDNRRVGCLTFFSTSRPSDFMHLHLFVRLTDYCVQICMYKYVGLPGDTPVQLVVN